MRRKTGSILRAAKVRPRTAAKAAECPRHMDAHASCRGHGSDSGRTIAMRRASTMGMNGTSFRGASSILVGLCTRQLEQRALGRMLAIARYCALRRDRLFHCRRGAVTALVPSGKVAGRHSTAA